MISSSEPMKYDINLVYIYFYGTRYLTLAVRAGFSMHRLGWEGGGGSSF